MKDIVFDFDDYRKYLIAALPTLGPGRGERTQLAQSLGVQKSYVSEVLNAKAEFSLEQAYRISRFLAHTEEEREYFLLLVQRARAGSVDLESHFRKKIREIAERRREVSERIRTLTRITEGDQLTYYSSWHFTAVHMCLRVPNTRTVGAIAEYLRLPKERVIEALEFLMHTGLAVQSGSHYKAGETRIHLPSRSRLVSKHHANWRLQALKSVDWNKKEHLHYTSIMSVSRKAAELIREALLKAIESVEPIIREAKDEEVCAMTLDFFDLRGIE